MMWKWYYTILLVLLSGGCGLGIGEIGLRVANLYPPPSPPGCHTIESVVCDLYEAHEPYGYRLKPNTNQTYLYPKHAPRELRVHANSNGFRSSRELTVTDSKKHILVLGDSFVFGQGVEESERFTDVLEGLHPNWRVDNIGMPGWGPDFMLMALQTVGVSLASDVVVMTIYTDDFRRVHPYYSGMGFKTPRLTLTSGHLEIMPYPALGIFQRTRIYQGLYQLYWNRTDAALDLFEAILDEFLRLSEKHRFKGVLVYIPGKAKKGRGKENDIARRDWLKTYASAHSTPFLDLTEVLHGYPLEKVFINNNTHLNPKGHYVVAEQLEGFLGELTELADSSESATMF